MLEIISAQFSSLLSPFLSSIFSLSLLLSHFSYILLIDVHSPYLSLTRSHLQCMIFHLSFMPMLLFFIRFASSIPTYIRSRAIATVKNVKIFSEHAGIACCEQSMWYCAEKNFSNAIHKYT